MRPEPRAPSPEPCGFTLIEVVLVAVILAILLTATVPRFQQTARRLGAERAAFELAQLARFAHERAVAESREMVWVWDAEHSRVRIEPAETSEASPEGGAGDRTESAPLPSGSGVSVAVGNQEPNCRCIRFFPEGTAEGATLTVTMDEQTYAVTVDAATGQARVAPGAPAS